MKTAVVTGASGFIGSRLCAELLDSGWHVVGIGRSAAGLLKEQLDSDAFEFHEIEFAHYDLLTDFVPNESDVLYHLAWEGLEKANSRIGGSRANVGNVIASCLVADAAKAKRVRRFVFCGSDYQLKRAIDASLPKRAVRDRYGAAKQACSDFVRESLYGSETQYISSMMGLVYGPGDMSAKSVNTFIMMLESGAILNLLPYDYKVDMVLVSDAVSGLAALAEKELRGCEYHIGHVPVPSFGLFLEEMKSALESESELNFGAYHEPTMIDYSEIDLTQMMRDTGWVCSDGFAVGIHETRDWLRSIGRLSA